MGSSDLKSFQFCTCSNHMAANIMTAGMEVWMQVISSSVTVEHVAHRPSTVIPTIIISPDSATEVN